MRSTVSGWIMAAGMLLSAKGIAAAFDWRVSVLWKPLVVNVPGLTFSEPTKGSLDAGSGGVTQHETRNPRPQSRTQPWQTRRLRAQHARTWRVSCPVETQGEGVEEAAFGVGYNEA
jgi:hypothetical protein